jgi:hypothetical protein
MRRSGKKSSKLYWRKGSIQLIEEAKQMTNQVRAELDPLQVGIILLTLITAVIHLSLVFPSILFILNGLGYLALLGALFLPIPQLTGYRALVRWALVGYAALTIVLWILMGSRIPIAYVAKVDEVILIVLLWLDSRQGRS